MKEYQPGQDISAYTTVLHGDVSGIQDFIFNVSSQGAAKTLKARSFFVQAITKLCIKLIEERLEAQEDDCLLFYNGGGGFYVFCKELSENTFNDLRTTIQKDLKDIEIYLTLSRSVLRPEDFTQTWHNIRQSSLQDKLRKFDLFPAAFNPGKRYEANDEHWKKFAGLLNRSYKFDTSGTTRKQKIYKDTITLFDQHIRLDQNRSDQLQPNNINWYLPTWDKKLIEMDQEWVKHITTRNRIEDPEAEDVEVREGVIIDFETMGYFAKKRTGTDKIAVLKMDVDDLGLLFSNVCDWSRNKKMSDALKEFFENKILEIWKQDFKSNINGETTPFRYTIYPIFAGGDDCLIIGAWDAVFEFVLRIHERFEAFMQSKKDDLGLHKLPTISAAIIVVDSKFPAIRMGVLAEEGLSIAKSVNNNAKNRVFVFGKTLEWKDFKQACSLADDLERLIRVEKEPRSILQRIRNSHNAFEKLMRQALNERRIYNPAVWRLSYYIRKSKNKSSLQNIIERYQKALLSAVTGGVYMSADIFPVAARLAELKTKKSDNK